MPDFNQIYHNGATDERVQTDGRSHCFRPLISGLHKHLLYLNMVFILSSLSLSFSSIKNNPCFYIQYEDWTSVRWSRGSVLAIITQVRGFKPGRSRRIFKGEKIFRTPSFGGEVKPSVPCRRFAACKRSLNGVEVVISAKLPDNILAHSSTFRR